jgi:hypothetical protein
MELLPGKHLVSVCETQPITVKGCDSFSLKLLISNC